MKSRIKQDKSLIKHYKHSKIISFWDIIVLIILITTIVLFSIFTFPRSQGQHATIYHNNKIIGVYSLDDDKTINLLDGKMICKIENNSISVIESDCKNRICVNTRNISKTGQRIVCTPNKITIVISGDDDIIITGGTS